MAKVRSWAGLDVHASSVLAVTVDGETGEMTTQRLSGRTEEVVAFCVALPGPTRVAYEAGPTGSRSHGGLDRRRGWVCDRAPGTIERPAQDRIKTDRRDAQRLVRC